MTRALLPLLLLVLGACSTLPKDVVREPSYVLADTASTELARDLQPLLDAHPGQSGFHTLVAGSEAYAARLILVKSAQKSIDLQYYIWHDDLTGKVLHNRLLDAADRGVRVRLLLDDLDTAGKDEILRALDAHPNIEVRLYNPFSNRTVRAGNFVTDTARINRRMHNKTLTVDNRATIFGGRNIGDEYFGAGEDVGFADLDALAIGPVVDEVSTAFDLYWNSEWVYPIAAFYDKPLDAAQVAAYRAASDAYLEEARQSEYAKVLRALGMAQVADISMLDYAWSKWMVAYDHPGKVDAEEVLFETHLGPKLKAGMDATEQELLIVSPYFVPGDAFTAYLVGLVQRGVRVRVLTNSLAANDVALVHAGYMRYREDLLEGGVELFEYRASADQDEVNDAKGIGASSASLHAKFFGFDRRYIFIGSFNLDPRSVELNTEFGVYFRSEKYAGTLAEAFDHLTTLKAYQVILDDEGELQWLAIEAGDEVRLDQEPDTGFWQRVNTGFMSLIVPESQL